MNILDGNAGLGGAKPQGCLGHKNQLKSKLRDAYVFWFLAALGFLGLFSLPRRMWVDGKDRFIALSDFLSHGFTSQGLSPRSLYSLIGPLFSTPLWYLGKWVADPEFWCVSYNFILFWLGLGVFYRLIKNRVGLSVARNFILLMIFGSMFPFHLKHFYGEVFSAFAVCLGIWFAILESRTWFGWILVALGVANAPAMALGLVLVSFTLSFEGRSDLRKVANAWLPTIFAAGLILLERWIRRGSMSASGYENASGAGQFSAFTEPLLIGLVSIFFSFSKGLIFYIPGVFVWPRFAGERLVGLRLVYRLWIVCLLGMAIVYSMWWAWFGGWFWGPRFFLMACIPASLAMAVRMESSKSFGQNLVLVFVLSLIFWVGVCSAVFGQDCLTFCETAPPSELACWYAPQYSALIRPWIEHRPLVLRDYFLFAVWGVAYLKVVSPFWFKLASFDASLNQKGLTTLAAFRDGPT